MPEQATSSSRRLYTPRLLALSTELARFPLDDSFTHRAEARSRTCGSTIELGVDLDPEGRVARLGMAISACAIGQSSAAIMALSAEGHSAEELAAIYSDIEGWLAAGVDNPAALPEWPGFDALAPALPHKGRHGALLLSWTAVSEAMGKAAAQALSSQPSAR